MTVSTYHSIREVPVGLWDGLQGPGNIFHSHAFLRATEEARVEDSRSWYLVFHAGDQAVATAVLSLFTVDLVLFIGGGEVIRFLRRFSPGFLRVRLLMCGIPVSLGQRNVSIPDPGHVGEVVDLLLGRMEALAAELGVGHLVLKEFAPRDERFGIFVEQAGFFKGHSLPYLSLSQRWTTFTQYLGSMRAGYRRQALASLDKIGRAAPGVRSLSMQELRSSKGPVLALLEGADYPPEQFMPGYQSVMERATTKLETLNAAFFEALFRAMPGQLRVLVLAVDGEVMGSALLMPNGEEITFALIAKEEERDPFDTYYNLMLGIVEHAIDKGFRRVGLGQTGHWPKQRIGGEAEERHLYYRARKPFLHALLRSARKVLFPRIAITPVRVFKAHPDVT
jgi:predicted N-acyltransferase